MAYATFADGFRRVRRASAGRHADVRLDEDDTLVEARHVAVGARALAPARASLEVCRRSSRPLALAARLSPAARGRGDGRQFCVKKPHVRPPPRTSLPLKILIVPPMRALADRPRN